MAWGILTIAATSLNTAKLSDKAARPMPDYVKQSVIYQMQMRSFTPEGTLKAARAYLPELAELGVDIIYLTPVYVSDDDPDPKTWSPRQRASKTNNPRNPYRMKDYYHVDPEYGTAEDLKEFIATAHKLKMRVMLDVVYYHCGPNAIFLKDHPDFIKRKKDGNLSPNKFWGFPLINHDNPQLREYLLKNMEYWVTDFGADGFRADVAYRIPISFWNEARRRLDKIRPGIIMLAEGGYQSQLQAFDIDYLFEWTRSLHQIYDGRKPASHARKTWESLLSKYPHGARFIRYLENHDVANDAFNRRPDKKWGQKVVDSALVLNFTIDGVPFLYNGQEISDTARHSIFGRMSIDWSTADTPQGKARNSLCKKLCALRHVEKSLTHGSVTWLDNSSPDDVLSFLRSKDGEQILVVINMKKKAAAVEIELPSSSRSKFQSLLTRGVKKATQKDGKKVFMLEGCAFFVGKRNER